MPAASGRDRVRVETGVDGLPAAAPLSGGRLFYRVRKTATGAFPLALVLIVWLAEVPAPPLSCLLIGFALIAAGVGLRIWAGGHLVKKEVLTTSGPFAHLRHPLYLGSSIIGAGFCLVSGLWWSWAALGFLAVPIYGWQIGAEERLLASRFGSAFAHYYRSVPRLIPRWRPARLEGQRGRFRLSRVLANREHHWSGAIVLLAMALWAVRAF